MAKQLTYLLLGSNLGDRPAILAQAVEALEQRLGAAVAISQLYETAAWGKSDQPAFLNQAVSFETALKPEALLTICQHVEIYLAPRKRERWGARHLDIDILLLGNTLIDTDKLTIPHRWLAMRRFALQPLAEIAPEFIHPIHQLSIKELLKACPDELEVIIFAGKS